MANRSQNVSATTPTNPIRWIAAWKSQPRKMLCESFVRIVQPIAVTALANN